MKDHKKKYKWDKEIRTENKRDGRMIEYKSSKLLGDLNMEKGIEIEEIKWIEIKLQKLTILK